MGFPAPGDGQLGVPRAWWQRELHLYRLYPKGAQRGHAFGLARFAPPDATPGPDPGFAFEKTLGPAILLAIGPIDEADLRAKPFTQLAALMTRDKKAAELECLCQTQRANAPTDPHLWQYEALVNVVKKQPVEAAALFRRPISILP